MNFTSVYRYMPLVSHECNSYSLNLAEKTKLSKIWPRVICFGAKGQKWPWFKSLFLKFGTQLKALDQIDEKTDYLLLRIYKILSTISAFLKLWPFVSTHMRASAIFSALLLRNYLKQTIHISKTSTFQADYCQCFTFKICDKFKTKMY